MENILLTSSDTTHAQQQQQEIKKQGPWINLPLEIVDIILIFLGDVDACGILLMTSKTVFQPRIKVYEFLCKHIYCKQTSKKSCDIKKWKSWRDMLIARPRLRTNGFYSLKTTFTKNYNNDAFWEEKKFETIEVKYYRHFRFYNNGRVLYSLDITEPDEMGKLLRSGNPIAKRVFVGSYRLKKNIVVVEVTLHYCQMIFELAILDLMDLYAEYDTQNRGRFNCLQLISHRSRQPQFGDDAELGEIDEDQLVRYPIPQHNHFYFYRQWNYYG